MSKVKLTTVKQDGKAVKRNAFFTLSPKLGKRVEGLSVVKTDGVTESLSKTVELGDTKFSRELTTKAASIATKHGVRLTQGTYGQVIASKSLVQSEAEVALQAWSKRLAEIRKEIKAGVSVETFRAELVSHVGK